LRAQSTQHELDFMSSVELYKTKVEQLKTEAEIFGVVLYSDGAIIAKPPTSISGLVSGCHLANACLEIHDCQKQLNEGGKKDAQYT
jgi:hypothetical protein